jgi:hypothetical protein
LEFTRLILFAEMWRLPSLTNTPPRQMLGGMRIF